MLLDIIGTFAFFKMRYAKTTKYTTRKFLQRLVFKRCSNVNFSVHVG